MSFASVLKPYQTVTSIQCDGICATWLHRHCAGLSLAAFDVVSNSNDPFYCPQCRLDKHELEIRSLREMITSLASQLAALKVAPSNSSPSSSPPMLESSTSSTPSPTSESSPTLIGDAVGMLLFHHMAVVSQLANRKCNLVVFGVPECSQGAQRFNRLLHDLDGISSVITGLDSNISRSAVVDCHRLGKYDPKRSRPRPILAQFARPIDVLSILAKRKELGGGFSVKADLSKQERVVEKLLLGERWKLIQAGTTRRDLRIRGSVLMVRGTVHTRVSDGILSVEMPPQGLSSPSHESVRALPDPASHTHDCTASEWTSTQGNLGISPPSQGQILQDGASVDHSL